MISATSESGSTVEVKHIVLEASSQWFIETNLTKHCLIDHMETSTLIFKLYDQFDSISFEEHEFLFYIPYEWFSVITDSLLLNKSISVMKSNMLSNKPWA